MKTTILTILMLVASNATASHAMALAKPKAPECYVSINGQSAEVESKSFDDTYVIYSIARGAQSYSIKIEGHHSVKVKDLYKFNFAEITILSNNMHFSTQAGFQSERNMLVQGLSLGNDSLYIKCKRQP